MIFIKPKKGKKKKNLHQVLASGLKYKYADFITEKKISTTFLHQVLQMTLELFHKNKTKTQKKINSVNGLLRHQRLFGETCTGSYQEEQCLARD